MALILYNSFLSLFYGQITRILIVSGTKCICMADQWKRDGEIKIIEMILLCFSKNFRENRVQVCLAAKNDHFMLREIS